MKICISFDSDFGAEPHSVSTPSKGTVLVEKIKHFIGLDDSVCHRLFDVDTCARQFCWETRAILSKLLEIL
jgi:hypothetical protein